MTRASTRPSSSTPTSRSSPKAASRSPGRSAAPRCAQAIEKYRPTLSLHGHIHESKAATRIGPTLAINPGSEYPEGLLRGAVVDLDRSGINSYVLTKASWRRLTIASIAPDRDLQQ